MSMSQLLFSFQGRLNRKPYWMTAIVITALMIVLIVIAIAFFVEREIGASIAVVALIALLYIPLIWIGLAVGAKRLHDRDKSAWCCCCSMPCRQFCRRPPTASRAEASSCIS